MTSNLPCHLPAIPCHVLCDLLALIRCSFGQVLKAYASEFLVTATAFLTCAHDGTPAPPEARNSLADWYLGIIASAVTDALANLSLQQSW